MSGLRDKPIHPEGLTTNHVNGVLAGSAHVQGYQGGMTYREHVFSGLLAAFAKEGSRSKREAIGDALAWTDEAIAAFEAQGTD